jgi:hypothetical protein
MLFKTLGACKSTKNEVKAERNTTRALLTIKSIEIIRMVGTAAALALFFSSRWQ